MRSDLAVHNEHMIRSQVGMHVKLLQSGSVFCKHSDCEQPATHLFRSGTLLAYCEFHARSEAVKIGIDLSVTMPPTGAEMHQRPLDRSIRPAISEIFDEPKSVVEPT